MKTMLATQLHLFVFRSCWYITKALSTKAWVWKPAGRRQISSQFKFHTDISQLFVGEMLMLSCFFFLDCIYGLCCTQHSVGSFPLHYSIRHSYIMQVLLLIRSNEMGMLSLKLSCPLVWAHWRICRLLHSLFNETSVIFPPLFSFMQKLSNSLGFWAQKTFRLLL